MRRKSFFYPLSLTLLVGVALSGVCVLTAEAISGSHHDAKPACARPAAGACPACARADGDYAACAAKAEAGEEGACPYCAAMKDQRPKEQHVLHVRLGEATKALEAAEKAVEAGDKKAALTAIAKARALLTPPASEKPKAEQAGILNARCPMMGTKLDSGRVPEKLTREFQGKRIGFCCAGCPAAWDALRDEQKQEKLDAVTN